MMSKGVSMFLCLFFAISDAASPMPTSQPSAAPTMLVDGTCIKAYWGQADASFNRVTAPFQYCYEECPLLCNEKCESLGYNFFGLECAGQSDPGSIH